MDAYVRKGGDLADTVGRACLCNGLTADIGLGQRRRDGYVEPPAVTLGQDLDGVRRLLREHPEGWTAAEAIAWLTRDVQARPEPSVAPAGPAAVDAC